MPEAGHDRTELRRFIVKEKGENERPARDVLRGFGGGRQITTDERIEKLAANQKKTHVLHAGVLESIQRLERIAVRPLD